MSVKQPSELAKAIVAINEEAGPEGLTPEQFVLAAIRHWAKMDTFFRQFDPKLLPSIVTDGIEEFVIFKQNGTDHYFGIPMSGTVLLERLGIYNRANLAGYGPTISAVLMRQLDLAGYEFFGVRHAPIERGPNGPVETSQFDIKPSRLDHILRNTAYIGYKMTAEFNGAWLLIPKVNLIPQGVHNV